jgi:2-haloacid dehalogenase
MPRGIPTSRRAFLSGLAGVAAAVAPGPAAHAGGPRAIKALALDGFTSFDPRPIGTLAEQLFPGKGAELIAAWRTRQFEYTWLRTVMHRYADFWTVTEEALVFAANASRVTLAAGPRAQLMDAFLRLTAYPDVRPALAALHQAGIRLAFLTNLTPRLLDAAIDNAGLRDLVDYRISTDAIRTYKPDPRAYQLGVDRLGLAMGEIAFVASGGWDAAGAKAFGYPTFWINRPHQPVEELGVRPDGIGTSLADLAPFLTA